MNHLSSETLIDYLHGELRPQDDAFAHAHLAACAACRATRDSEAALSDFIRSSDTAQEQEFPSLVAATVWQRIRETSPSPLERFAAYLRPAIAVPVAAVLLVGGWLASPLGRAPNGAHSVNALYYFQAHAAQSATSPLSEHSGMPAAETLSEGTVAPPPMLDQYAAYAFSGRLDAMH